MVDVTEKWLILVVKCTYVTWIFENKVDRLDVILKVKRREEERRLKIISGEK
ncbi:MAG: hypothetical protein K9N06_01970 [Candidatus Cloacimonetes bacterium]|nr:hypothetical protein [Candidatus Cloacimonadota bacterium]